MGWEEKMGEGKSQADQEQSRGNSSLEKGGEACITTRINPAQRAASADTEGDLPKVRTAGAGPGNK